MAFIILCFFWWKSLKKLKKLVFLGLNSCYTVLYPLYSDQNQGPIWVSVSEPKLFFLKLTLFLFKIFFSCFPIFWESISFYELINKPRSTNIQYLTVNFVLRALLWGKKYPILSVTRFSLWNVVSVSVKVSAEGIGQFGFWFWYWI